MQLKLEELLRYGFAGAFGLIALVLCFTGSAALATTVPAVTQASILLGVSLALGTLVYAVHRAAIYPLILRLILLLLVAFRVYYFDWWLLLPYRPTHLERELDFLRWRRSKEEDYAQPRLGEWGAQIHFLYCSSWAVFIALWLGEHVPTWEPTSSKPYLWWGAWLIVGGAFLSNYRLAYYDSRVALRDTPSLGGPPRLTESEKRRPPEKKERPPMN